VKGETQYTAGCENWDRVSGFGVKVFTGNMG
jgi:hypothetical protein